jgi:GNAT superfamily N-acetyltransferase
MAVPLQRMEAEIALVPSDVQVREVRSAADRDRFIDLQYALYRHDPHFVPPLRMERRDFLDASKNPFFLHADVDLFLATRGERVLGRIAVVNDRNYNQFHGTRMATFGLFECVDEPGVAKALFQKAEKWARDRKLDSLLGPVNLSTNYDCGLLVDGFDAPPVFLMTYNPRYYMDLFEAVGLSKAKDLWAWNIEMTAKPDPKILRIAEKIRAREGVRVRPVEMAHLGTEIRRIKEIYNSAWEKNWGFVPMTEAEFDHMAKDMKAVVNPELLLIAEVKGQPVAFAMSLPDMNQAFAKVTDGRLTRFGLPIGLGKLLLGQRKVNRARLVTLGIKEGFRRRGLDAILYIDTIQAARRLGYTGGEISWTLEDNDLVNRAIESMGGTRYKTYRLYEKGL